MDDMTDEELQALIMSGGGIAQADAKLKQSVAMAEALRNMAPDTGMIRGGRTVRATSPLSIAASVLNAYQTKKNIDQQGALGAEKAKAMTGQNQAVLAALLRRRKPQATGSAAFSQRPMPGEDDEDPSYGYASPL